MDITEPGTSRQIRILNEDAEYLETQKLVPEEPWYKVVSRVLQEHRSAKKHKI